MQYVARPAFRSEEGGEKNRDAGEVIRGTRIMSSAGICGGRKKKRREVEKNNSGNETELLRLSGFMRQQIDPRRRARTLNWILPRCDHVELLRFRPITRA